MLTDTSGIRSVLAGELSPDNLEIVFHDTISTLSGMEDFKPPMLMRG